MTQVAISAMEGITVVFDFITSNSELAVIALGFPFVRGAARVVKRLIKL